MSRATFPSWEPEFQRAYQKTRRQYLRDRGLCISCAKRPIAQEKTKNHCIDCLEKNRRRDNEWRKNNQSKRTAYMRIYNDRVRTEVFNAYGGAVCRCCGETNTAFLEMDHINNDGAEHRRTLRKNRTWNWIYRWLKSNNYPPGFQVLCSNCNKAKWRYGICPHQEAKDKNATLD